MISITLLAGFVPLLQVTFIVVGRILIRITRCERSGQNHRIAGFDPYHVVSEHWVDHGEIDLLIVYHTGSWQIAEIGLLIVCWI